VILFKEKIIFIKMEGITNEIRNKIKCAVKAKLQEIGAYVDEELPDYIMVQYQI
jgi:hypothetical protein